MREFYVCKSLALWINCTLNGGKRNEAVEHVRYLYSHQILQITFKDINLIVSLQKKESTDAERLHMDHLEGVFLVLTYGSIFAFLYGVFDVVRVIKKRAKDFNVRKRI